MNTTQLEQMSKEDLIRYALGLQSALSNSAMTIQKCQRNIQNLTEERDRLIIDKRELNEQLNELIKKYQLKVEQYEKAAVEQFCPKTEKLCKETTVVNEAEVLEGEYQVQKKAKGKGGRKSATKNFIDVLKELATRTEVEDYDFDGNGIKRGDVKEFGRDENYKIEFHPGSIEVVKIERPKYKDSEKIYQAVSADVFPHSPLTPSLAANIIEMKYSLAVPLDRYSHYLNSHGIPISPQTLGNYVTRSVELLKPLYAAMVDALVNNSAHVIHSDETKEVVLDDTERVFSYMFVYTTSFYDMPVYIYQFNVTRTTEQTKELLKDFEGYVVVDGYDGYNKLRSDKIKLQRCLVHVRRYFYDAYKVLPAKLKEESTSGHVVELMDKIFKKEAEFKKSRLTIDEIKNQRNSKEYLAMIEALDDYVNSIQCPEESLLGKAVSYYHNLRSEMFTYLENGYIDPDNNIAERAVKPFVIGRKNWLFNKNYAGATNTGILYSIVHTAKANGLKSEQYLTYVLENITKKNIEDLLPWSKEIPNEIKISA